MKQFKRWDMKAMQLDLNPGKQTYSYVYIHNITNGDIINTAYDKRMSNVHIQNDTVCN